MEVKEVDPSMVTIDKMNERKGTADEEFVENVKATGLIQPPLVRKLNGEGMDASMGAEYSVVVGGRRVDAATQAGLDSIPVFVVEWDDGEALLASITENIDAFREEVDEDSRAIATQRIKNELQLTNRDLAEKLGVSRRWVDRWLEPLRDEWEGTQFHAETQSDEKDLEVHNNTEEIGQKPRVKKQTMVRQMTPDATPQEREQIMQTVEEKGLSLHDVEEVKQSFNRGADLNEAIETVQQESTEQKRTGGIKVSTRVVFTGDYATALETAAQDRSASDEQIVRTAVSHWLEQEGYL